MEKQLRETLEQVHAELREAPHLDAESRELLAQLVRDIEALLERGGGEGGGDSESLVDRLRESADRFEQSHPDLTTAVGRVADLLSRMGI